MDKKISAVIIDTSAYYKAQSDFAGINNSIIPMFLRLLKANNVQLLTHPILEYEIRKHIKDSALVKRANDLETQIKRCQDQLRLVGVSQSEWLEKIAGMEIEKRLSDAFSTFYAEAVSLPYVSAEEVFCDYFQTKAPFSEAGKKKSEFPDAFVIKSIMNYCSQAPSIKVLVVSDDTDWIKACQSEKQIVLVNNFAEAMMQLWRQLEDKSEFIRSLVDSQLSEIEANIATAAGNQAFCIDSVETIDEIDIASIRAVVMKESYVPLEITNGSVLLQIGASLSVDGSADFFDEERSVWDREDGCYYYHAYTHIDFTGASAIIDCEVRIDFSPDGNAYQSKLAFTKPVNKWDISLNLSNAEVAEKDIDESARADYEADQADALEEYYKH